MKKNYILAFLALMLFRPDFARADTQSPYKMDFNTEIETSAHDFKVAPGWGHVVGTYEDEYYDTYYVSYSYSADGGIDGSGALKAGDQTDVGSWESTGETTDLLVTPKLTGEVSLYVKKASSNGTIKFVSVTPNGSKYIVGNDIDVTLPELSTDEYVKVTLPAQEGGQIGLWCSNVYIDDFEAASADIELSKALTLSTVKLTSSAEPDCTPEGKYQIKMSVTVKNTGETELKPGDENYSLSIVNYSANNAVMSVTPIDKTLAVGEETTLDVEAAVDYVTYSNRSRFDVMENLTKTTKYGGWIEPIPYSPVVTVRGDDGKIDNGSAIDFGQLTEEASRTLSIENSGAAPLNLTEVAIPEGFASTLTAPQTIAPHGKVDFTLSAKVETSGVKSGAFIIKGEDVDDFVLNLSSTVLDKSKFFADFEDGNLPAGSIADERWSVQSWDEDGNTHVLQNSSVDASKFVLPLLEVAEGEKMSFYAGRRSYNSFVNVYYSSDRKNWTLVKEIIADQMPTDMVGGYGSYDYKLAPFTVEGIPFGKQYIAFESGYSNIDNIYGFTPVSVDHDLAVTNESLPLTAMVNNEYVAKMTVKNINSKAETNYTVSLYVDDEKVADAEPAEITAGETHEFVLSTTFHSATTKKAYILFTAGDYTLSTDTVTIAVEEETASKDIVAGQSDGAYEGAPLRTFYKGSESETIYTAEQLGLKEGEKITKIAFRGYNESKDLTTNLKAWIENTDDAAYADSYEARPKEDMTLVYDGEYTFTKAGSASDLRPMIEIKLKEPFVYSGRNIRIALRAEGDSYAKIYFEQNSADTDHSILRYKDSGLDDASFSKTAQPVAVITIATDPLTVSGTVKDSHGYSIPNAKVKLTSGNVIYSGEADYKGAFTIDVIQTDKEYTLSTMAEGFADGQTEGISFAEGSIEDADVVMRMLDRTFTVGAPTAVCLPVDLTESEIEAAGKFYTLSSYNEGQAVMLRSDKVEAGKPYVFVPAVETPFTGMADYEISVQPTEESIGGLCFNGNYGIELIPITDVLRDFVVDGADMESTVLTNASGFKLLPFSAHFVITELPSNTIKVTFLENIPDAIESISDNKKADDRIYTIDGRYIGKKSELRQIKRGIYIVNGKKVVF